jgi:hypothetical protein
MTEYEAADLMATYSSNLVQSQAVFITIFSAYMIVAYIAGTDLSRFQVSLITAAFVMLAILGYQGAVHTLGEIFIYAEKVQLMRGEGYNSTMGKTMGLGVFVGVRIVMDLGALVFMWQVRHSKTE